MLWLCQDAKHCSSELLLLLVNAVACHHCCGCCDELSNAATWLQCCVYSLVGVQPCAVFSLVSAQPSAVFSPVQCSALCSFRAVFSLVSVQPTQLVSICMCGISARFVHPKQLFWESKYNLHHLLRILSRTSACAD